MNWKVKSEDCCLNLKLENDYWNQGFIDVVGVDEVGRGSLAGPVVAAAVSFPINHTVISGINDSKQLTPFKREALDLVIRAHTKGIGIGQVSAKKIDQIGIISATKLAMRRACANLDHQIILVDGPSILDLDKLCIQGKAIIKGDIKIYSIAAASIVAKVYRDKLITNLSQKYPQYQWQNNKGYGTKAHIEAILTYGLTPLHRKSFTVRQ